MFQKRNTVIKPTLAIGNVHSQSINRLRKNRYKKELYIERKVLGENIYKDLEEVKPRKPGKRNK